MYNESNNYCEVIVTPPPPEKLGLIMNLYLVVAALSLVLTVFISPLLIVVLPICLFLRIRSKKQAQIEIEYQFWGRQLDIEMVIAGEKRKSMATFQMDQVEFMAPEGDGALESYEARLGAREMKKLDLTDRDPNGAIAYVMYIRDEKEMIRVRLQPSREMLRKMWQVAPRAVKIPQEIKSLREEEL